MDRPMGAVEWDPMARIVERVHDRSFKALANGRPHPLKRYDPALEVEVGRWAFWALSSKAAWKRWFLTGLDLWKLEPRRQRKLREQERERRRGRRQYDERRHGVTEREWRRLRREVLSAEPHYRTCGGRATQVDHVVPVWKGGKTEPDNLQPLCRLCHQEKSAREQARLYDGLWLAFSAGREPTGSVRRITRQPTRGQT
jgi:5-methylcytosine-specific restriction protein A